MESIFIDGLETYRIGYFMGGGLLSGLHEGKGTRDMEDWFQRVEGCSGVRRDSLVCILNLRGEEMELRGLVRGLDSSSDNLGLMRRL